VASYETQVITYKKLIEGHPNWVLAGIYADEGKSGTTRQKRTNFNRMMRDALSGKIDYIITKSISRFARNQKDMLECITLLKEHDPPVGVFFEEENLDSLDKSKEFIFSILSMVAQDQSRSISENVKWAVQKNFQAGQAIVNPSQLLGYEKGKNKEWVIVPEQADIIKFIFNQFLECGNASQIAESFMEMLYSCKKEIEVHKGRLNRKFRAAYNKQKQKKDCEEILLEVAELEEELRTLHDCRRRIKEQYEIQYSIRYFTGANTCMEIMNGIDKSIKNAEKQKNADIRQLEEVKQLQNQYNAFVEDILNLPELNMVGIRLNVFGRDVFSTEKSIAHSRKKVTPDNISKAPDWLDFSQDLFERYVEWGEVKKNKIVYHMTFGVTLAAYNIKRGIRDYIGYRYVKNDGTIGCIRNTQVLYDELLRRNS